MNQPDAISQHRKGLSKTLAIAALTGATVVVLTLPTANADPTTPPPPPPGAIPGFPPGMPPGTPPTTPELVGGGSSSSLMLAISLGICFGAISFPASNWRGTTLTTLGGAGGTKRFSSQALKALNAAMAKSARDATAPLRLTVPCGLWHAGESAGFISVPQSCALERVSTEKTASAAIP